MDIHYPAELQRFTNQHLKSYLELDSYNILIEKARSLRGQLLKGEWKFLIPREHPLTFKKNNSNLQIDIACKIEGLGSEIKKHNIELRVWLIKNDTRELIFNFRIDRRDSNAKEPKHHMHIGDFDAPRFPFPPMDIILLCEFVLVNFFHEKSEDLRKDGGWRTIVIKSQHLFQKEYFHMCQNCIINNSDATLMEHLQNLP